MRVSTYDAAALEAQIGSRDGTSGVTSANRHLVQNWLVTQGFSSEWSKARKVATLYKLYNRPRYLARLIELREAGKLTGADIDDDAPAALIPDDRAPLFPAVAMPVRSSPR